MKRPGNKLLSILLIICIGIIGIIIYVYYPKTSNNIMSFDDCVKAGHQVLNSQPPQCRTSDGKTFVQEISTEAKEQTQPTPSVSPTSNSNYAVSEILVQFKRATSDDIAALFNKYNLKYELKMYTDIPALAIVEVPKGEEMKWITIFKKEPLVLTANYNNKNKLN